MKNMQIISSHNLLTCHQLAQNLYDSHDNLILQFGQRISQQLLEQIQTQQEQPVQIFIWQNISNEEQFDEYEHSLKNNIEMLFSASRDSPTMQQLKKILLDYRLQNLLENGD